MVDSTEKPDYWFIFVKDQLLLLNQHEFEPLSADFITSLQPFFSNEFKLGTFNHRTCFCAEIADQINLPDATHLLSVKKALNSLNHEWFSVAAKAWLVLNWDKNHRFCGRCGGVTSPKPGVFERICLQCGLSFHPRISPTVIVLIKKNDQLLMARSSHFPKGAFALIAGFVEPGESLEEAAHREVKEEVNLTIKNLNYFGSQTWPFPDSLMIGFIVDYDSGEIKLDPQELEAAGWYRFDNLPGRPTSPNSIATQMIDYFIAEQEHNS